MSVLANGIFSCKAITDATVKSDDTYGTALYGDSASDRRYMSMVKPEVLLMQHQKSLQYLPKTKLPFASVFPLLSRAYTNTLYVCFIK